ncbi:MAG: hypothetical protein M3R11_06495 [Acidobacteriota bacterium]|jgi:hypothetical protein|nr:hypothetical protein [Acidobacteriota bacterium]
MTYINISYVAENENIDRDTVIKAIQSLDISEDAKYETYEAIYNVRPYGVMLDDKGAEDAINLKRVLRKLGIPHRQSETQER